jgi:hypothetical protein
LVYFAVPAASGVLFFDHWNDLVDNLRWTALWLGTLAVAVAASSRFLPALGPMRGALAGLWVCIAGTMWAFVAGLAWYPVADLGSFIFFFIYGGFAVVTIPFSMLIGAATGFWLRRRRPERFGAVGRGP